MTVVIEVAGSDRFPARPGIGSDHTAADDAGPVHPQTRPRPPAVLPWDAGMPVFIEAPGPDRFPARPGIGSDHTAADDEGPVHLPPRDLAAARVLKQDVGMTVVIEVAGS